MINHGYTYILVIPFPLGGGGIFVQIERNREEFEGGLHEKRREKKKKEKSDKTHVKYLYEA